MAIKDNAPINVPREQKNEFIRLARNRKTTHAKLFGDMLKLANTKVHVARLNPGENPGIIQAQIITEDEVIQAEVIPDDGVIQARVVI